MKDLIGKTLGQYQILEKIGQGGMARVFKAYQPGLDRFVAVKVLSPSVAEETGFSERFQREALSAARLHHPHILEVYDFGAQDGYNYLVMRYVENSRTLGDVIEEGAPLGQLIEYIIQVADALNYAHSRGVVHRDVKPSNILVDGKWAMLADFGLAKVAQTSSQLTGTGVGIGTPAYMSPEQASGVNVDHRTDIYALGVILYRILTGTVPHDAPTPFAILARRVSEPVRSVRELAPKVPESLDQVVMRSLTMEPDGRYSSAAHFADALQRARQDPTIKEAESATLFRTPGDTAMISRPADEGLTAQGALRREPAAGARSALPRSALFIAAALIGGIVIVGALVLVLFTFLLRDGDTLAGSTAAASPSPTASLAPVVVETEAPPPTPGHTPTPMPRGIPSALAKIDLEVRGGPGDGYELLGYLPAGASAEIISRDQARQWWQIQTSLSSAGVGWIQAGSEFSEAIDVDNVPIALAPPTPTPPAQATPVPTSTATPVPGTPTAAASPTRPAPTQAPARAPAEPAPTRAPETPAGQFTLLRPTVEQPTYGATQFEWRWTSPLPAGQGFEVRVWREGEPPAGVHNSVEDNLSGKVQEAGSNTYRLSVDIREAAGVRGRGGEYLWTVALVQVSPEYKDLGIQAPPGRLRFEAGGDGGGEDGGGTKPTF
jgi:hypothetical protein